MAKTVVLTGGAAGMGAATAARLRASAAELTVLDVTEPTHGDGYVACDLGDPESIDRALARLPDRIDALVNVAGIAEAANPLTVLTVNFLGLRQLSEALLPRVASGGTVVIVASTAGHDWRARRDDVNAVLDTADFETGAAWLEDHRPVWIDNPYKFSKQCAAAYTHRLSGLALGRDVRVNCVNPGAVETQLTPAFKDLLGHAMYDWGVDQIGRHAQPDDVAEIIEFLAIGPCRWLNGVEIQVDGGYLSGLFGGWVDPEQAPA